MQHATPNFIDAVDRLRKRCLCNNAFHTLTPMSVQFLCSAQRQKYGCFSAEPTPAELARYFYLGVAPHALLDGLELE